MDLILENIINWCKKNSLPIAKGISEDRRRENVFEVEFENYTDFLNFCNSLPSAVLIYSFENFDLKESIGELLEVDEDDAEGIVEKSFQDYKQFDGRPNQLKLSCNYSGFTYLFVETEDWYFAFEEEVENQRNLELSIFESLRQATLPTQRFNEIVYKIATSFEFYAVHTRPSKVSALVHRMVLEENVGDFYVDLYSIEKLALKQLLYKHLNQKEQECREQITKLKGEGKTKKAIIALLKITEGMYDKLVGG